MHSRQSNGPSLSTDAKQSSLMKTQAGPPNGPRHKRRRTNPVFGPSHGTPLSARKNQTTTRPFRLIFEVGAGRSFSGNSRGKGGSFAERPTPLPASVVDPDGSEGFGLEMKR